jgi:hypothetical protein
MPRPSSKKSPPNGSALGFEATLWPAAEKLKGNMDAGEYKHVVLGLIFLKYIPSEDLIKSIMALPKKEAFVPDLMVICEHLAKRGYPKAVELKAEILKLFVED